MVIKNRPLGDFQTVNGTLAIPHFHVKGRLFFPCQSEPGIFPGLPVNRVVSQVLCVVTVKIFFRIEAKYMLDGRTERGIHTIRIVRIKDVLRIHVVHNPTIE